MFGHNASNSAGSASALDPFRLRSSTSASTVPSSSPAPKSYNLESLNALNSRPQTPATQASDPYNSGQIENANKLASIYADSLLKTTVELAEEKSRYTKTKQDLKLLAEKLAQKTEENAALQAQFIQAQTHCSASADSLQKEINVREYLKKLNALQNERIEQLIKENTILNALRMNEQKQISEMLKSLQAENASLQAQRDQDQAKISALSESLQIEVQLRLEGELKTTAIAEQLLQSEKDKTQLLTSYISLQTNLQQVQDRAFAIQKDVATHSVQIEVLQETANMSPAASSAAAASAAISIDSTPADIDWVNHALADIKESAPSTQVAQKRKFDDKSIEKTNDTELFNQSSSGFFTTHSDNAKRQKADNITFKP